LENLHTLRAARRKGDIDSAGILIDFFAVYKQTPLSQRESQSIYYRYEVQLTEREAALAMKVSVKSVSEYVKRAVAKLSRKFSQDE
jgi:DNA-directed RNA polymerase specialized sigma subunit